MAITTITTITAKGPSAEKMKKTLALLIALLTAAAVFGCAAPKKQTVSMFDLSQAMLAAYGEADSMAYASSADADPADKLRYVSEMDYDKAESFFISYAKDGKGNADEIVVIAVKDAADASEAVDSLKAHIDRRISLYSTYDPARVKDLEAAEVFSFEQYAVLVVADNAEAIVNAFYDFVK